MIFDAQIVVLRLLEARVSPAVLQVVLKRAQTKSDLAAALRLIDWDDHVEYDEEGVSTFKDFGISGVVCGGFACVLRKLMPNRTKIMGFNVNNNPESVIAQDVDGHDFAVVDGRYIVDPWLTEVESRYGTQNVFDLNSNIDALAVRKLYGDPTKWVPSHT